MNTKKTTKRVPLVHGTTAKALLEASAKLRTVREALSPDELRRINYDVAGAAAKVLTVVNGLSEEVRADLAAKTDWDGAKLSGLEKIALAALHAEDTWLRSTDDASVADELALIREGAALRTQLHRHLRVARQCSLVPGVDVKVPKVGRAFAEIPRDLAVLTTEVAKHWKVTKGKTPLTAEELERAKGLFGPISTALKTLAGLGRSPEAEDRFRAATLLINGYEHLTKAMAYARADHGDAKALTPTFFTRRSTGSRKAAKVGAPAEVAPAKVGGNDGKADAKVDVETPPIA